jgi:hypothetical protein
MITGNGHRHKAQDKIERRRHPKACDTTGDFVLDTYITFLYSSCVYTFFPRRCGFKYNKRAAADNGDL